MKTRKSRAGNNQVFPLKRALSGTAFMACYAMYFQSIPLVFGVILGGMLATGNFYLLRFFVGRILESKERQGRVHRIFRGLFFFKFFLLSLLLYTLARAGLVDLTGVIGGFTAVLLVVLYNYFLMLKEGNEFNGTSASLY